MTMNTNGHENHNGHVRPPIPPSSGESIEANAFEPRVIEAIANQFYSAIPSQNSSPVTGNNAILTPPERVVPKPIPTPAHSIPGSSLTEHPQLFSANIPQIYTPGNSSSSIPSIPGTTHVIPQEATVDSLGISEVALTEIVKQLQSPIPPVLPQGILDAITSISQTPIIPEKSADVSGNAGSKNLHPSLGISGRDVFSAIAQELYAQIPQIYPGNHNSGPISPPTDFSQLFPFNEKEVGTALKQVNSPTPVPGIPDAEHPSFYFLSQPQLETVKLDSHAGFDVQAVRRDFPILHQQVHGKPLIWLDNGATTQKPQSVIDSISHFYERDNSNIHRAAHDLAARATDAYEGAREKVQRFIGAGSAEEIVFVRGTTEGVNLVAQTFGRQQIREGDEIVLTTLEHHANIVPWQMLAQEKKAILRVVPITDRGEIILEEYTRLLGPRTRIVAVTQVSNSLGTIVPVQEMTAIAHRHGARVLIDGAQAVSHFPVNVQQLGCDFYVFSGHKLFAPTGIGVVYAKGELLEQIPPWQGGGNMIRQVTFEQTTYNDPPAKFEAGTPNIADAVGLGAAIDYLNRLGMVNIERYEHELTEYGTERLQTVPGLRLIGTAPHKVGVLSFILDNIPYEEVGKRLASEGIAVRAGHHCAQPSLQRYGLTGTVRPSLAFYNTREEIDTLAEVLRTIRYR
ncbi:family 2A encapsulin nanocompartment cargo protein cysteine desulfurase [Laspinema olomoucense]|uniref:family 2A encapsulin nanocompartment cargo protein cysteine desulfurase n=1 Tax=Laspinema olomoucense TaxID=3231600 RepID=UPI0021BA8AD1|nr:family 2A encapsulin nanocompartment cargo protein cysteine desulfurase [Laspinema sp. D3c]MCT7994295.1 cysteine desulfurase [Laspinema sp. D3c]